jgi:RND family efflux transporter MFP subunit
MMNKKLLYPIVVLAVGLGLAYLLAASKPQVEAVAYEPLIRTVRVMRVEAGAEYLTVSSQGTVQPRSQSELIPEVYGRVEWISPALVGGGAFKSGDILLRIESADYKSTLQRAQASLERAEVEQDYAGDELKRLEKLYAKKLASESQLDGARRAYRIAGANLSDSRATLEQAQRDLARTELTAPFDGLVRNEQVDLGQFVSRGQSIGTIYATDYVEVRLPIAADQLRYLGLPISRRGGIPEGERPPVTITADFGTARIIWEGELVRTEAEFDERSRMLYGVTRLASNENEDTPVIPVGLFVQAEIRGQRVDKVMRLPRSSMRDNNQVLVVDSEQRLRFRHVSILRLEHDEVLISEGLVEGELVCISPMQTVVDGMRVKPVFQ